ncbi:MAG: protein TolQ, partial [Rhodoplanes sp.]
MNPAELPGIASDISILGLFWKADWVVKLVMVGLLAASVGVWAIAIDKFILYARTRQAMKHFETVFWSGQSLEDLYRALSARPTDSMASLFVAAMREWKRSFEGPHPAVASLQMRLEKVMDVTIQREVER